MLLAYNKPNILTLYTVADGSTIDTGNKGFMLKPGINEIAKNVWASLAMLPKVKRLLENEIIQIFETSDSTDKDHAIKKLSVSAANKIIKKTFDINLLKSWRDCETRNGVSSVIKKQISDIYERTSKPKDNDDE